VPSVKNLHRQLIARADPSKKIIVRKAVCHHSPEPVVRSVCRGGGANGSTKLANM
jgi:hypothetical protein